MEAKSKVVRGTVYLVKERKSQKESLLSGRKLQAYGKTASQKQYVTSTVYKGEFVNNKRHGFGTQVWPNGSKYEGDWAFDAREGRGEFFVKSKDDTLRMVYSGSWLNDMKEGVGVWYGADGSRYEGHFHANLPHGEGTMFYPEGHVYVGQWLDGKRSGYGTLTLANGDVYEGEWLADKREGAGRYFYKSKSKMYDAEWVADIPKCGIYLDATDFFATASVNGDGDDGLPALAAAAARTGQTARPLPVLGMVDAETVLETQIRAIEHDRQALRNLPYIELSKLFDEEGLDDLRTIFGQADVDGVGRVPSQKLPELLAELSLHIEGPAELARLLADLQKDGSSSVTFSEFVQAAYLVEHAQSLAAQQATLNGEIAAD